MASKQILVDYDFANGSKIINLPDGVNPQDAATVAQLNTLIEGLAWKDSVRVAASSNINLAAPGASVDGVTMVLNDRFAAKNQTAPEDNGIYIWNGAATPATRAPDASTFDELESAVVSVEEGTSAGTTWRQSAVNGTLGVTAIVWAAFGSSAGAATESSAGIAEIATQAETDAGADDARFVTPLKLATSTLMIGRHAQTFGDGAATSYTITHNLNSRDVTANVYRNSGLYDRVEVGIEHTTVNAITITTAALVASNALRAVIKR